MRRYWHLAVQHINFVAGFVGAGALVTFGAFWTALPLWMQFLVAAGLIVLTLEAAQFLGGFLKPEKERAQKKEAPTPILDPARLAAAGYQDETVQKAIDLEARRLELEDGQRTRYKKVVDSAVFIVFMLLLMSIPYLWSFTKALMDLN